jgi:hypothetical protein
LSGVFPLLFSPNVSVFVVPDMTLLPHIPTSTYREKVSYCVHVI